jgi:hypothetical protein
MTPSIQVGTILIEDRLRDGLSLHSHCNRSVYENHCFQSLVPTLQRSHLALLKSRPDAVTESTDSGLLRNAPADLSLVRLLIRKVGQIA